MLVSDFLHDYNLVRQIQVYKLEKDYAGPHPPQDDFVLPTFFAALNLAERIERDRVVPPTLTSHATRLPTRSLGDTTDQGGHVPVTRSPTRRYMAASGLGQTASTSEERTRHPIETFTPTSTPTPTLTLTPSLTPSPTPTPTPTPTPEPTPELPKILALAVLARFIQEEQEGIVNSIMAYIDAHLSPVPVTSQGPSGRARRRGTRPGRNV